jgi:hypothetical protein
MGRARFDGGELRNFGLHFGFQHGAFGMFIAAVFDIIVKEGVGVGKDRWSPSRWGGWL